jgi:hypothetical protein
LIFCAARVFWCDLKQILERCSYKKLWKPTASTLSLRHGRTTNRKRTANLGGRPKGHRATCINLDLHDNERRWKWKRSKLLVSGSICFWISRNNRGIGHVSYRIIYLLGLTILYHIIFVLRNPCVLDRVCEKGVYYMGFRKRYSWIRWRAWVRAKPRFEL